MGWGMKEHFEIHFEIEKRCEFNCLHCSSANIRSYEKRGYTNVDIIEAIGLLKDYRVSVTLTGGEPLLTENLVETIREIRYVPIDIEIGLFTSGVIFSENRFWAVSGDLSETLKNAGLSYVYVSVYSDNETIHNGMTRINKAHQLMEASIKNFISAGIDVRFNTVIVKKNVASLNSLFDYAKQIGVSEVRLLKLVKHGSAVQHWGELVPNENEQELIEIITSCAKQLDNTLKVTIAGLPLYTPCRPFDTAQGCQAGLRVLYVDYSGYIYPCASQKNVEEQRLCHIHEVDKLKDLLYNISNNATCCVRPNGLCHKE